MATSPATAVADADASASLKDQRTSVSPGPIDSEKEAKALLVFGASVMLDDEDESFLKYSPSPLKPSDIGADATTLSKRESSTGCVPSRKDSRANLNTLDGKENDNNTNVQNPPELALGKHETGAPSPLSLRQRSCNLDQKSRSSITSELVQKTQAAIDRATLRINQSMQESVIQRPQRSTKPPLRLEKANSVRDEWQKDLDEAKEFYRDMHQKRVDGLKQRRQLSSLVSQERAAYKETARNAKLQSIIEESQFKSAVYRDHQTLLRDNEERRRRESVEAREKLWKSALEGKERMRMVNFEEEKKIYDDRQAGHEAVEKSKREAVEQRRKSYQFRLGDARRIRNLHSTMMAEQQARAAENAELDRKAARDVDEHKKQMEKERRESLANRNHYARQVRKNQKERLEEYQARQHSSSELDRAAAKDADEAKRQVEKERRESLLKRNLEARVIRQKEAEKEAQETEEQRKSSELNRAAAMDAEEYKAKMARERKDSLQLRGKEWVRQRECESKELAKDKEAKHVSFALKADAEKDVEKYKRQQEAERRQSLQNRNRERSRHAKVMQELELIAREQETESYVLKWAGDNDAKEFLKQMAQERRESLQQRGKEHSRIRRLEDEENRKKLEQAHEDEHLRACDQKDVEAFRSKCSERDRASLEYRNKEGRKQRLEETEIRHKEQKIEESNFQLETMARKDVDDYVRVCKERRRLSLAFRAKEKRGHLSWKERQQQAERMERDRTIRGRLMDQRYMELARQQEQIERAMEDLRHQHRIFGKVKKDTTST